jgi:predicted dehydrogenase/threonine dehydrogenase-like Zn-dependent dehydrogenase
LKQLIQNMGTGKSQVLEVPPPQTDPGGLLISTAVSLVSVGTERMVLEFAGQTLLQKARSRPDLVQQTLGKARRDGVLSTVDAVRNRLDQPMTLGYSLAGTVIDVGRDVTDFRVGDRVAAAGANLAVHAEIVSVPRNLVVKLPEPVDFESAAFTTVAAIALHGFRISQATLGESVAVIGLGLLGQISVQLARSAGCHVIGYDLLIERAERARCAGAIGLADTEAFVNECHRLSNGLGIDNVLITADTPSNDPVNLAGRIARDRAIVVSVGSVGTKLPRRDYFEKELEFRISRSYGPGRYDPSYEIEGNDYPPGYVRWTENRNMQAVVALIAERKLDLVSLITHRFDIAQGTSAYELISEENDEPFLGVVLNYPVTEKMRTRIDVGDTKEGAATGKIRLGMLGAGNFARSVLLPAIQSRGDVDFVGVATARGMSARQVADKYSFSYCASDSDEIMKDGEINTVVIATRHNLHADQTIQALNSGKHVFVEKPLCLTTEELYEIDRAYRNSAGSLLMVGFNRRFAPMAGKLREHFIPRSEPLLIHYRVNGGYIPSSEWLQRSGEGGGRLVGEAVHFIDWGIWLTGEMPETVHTVGTPNMGKYSDDNLSIVVKFAEGSILQILYAANGDPAAGKERIEVFGGGRTAILDDFARLELISSSRRRVERRRLRSDKGHRAAWSAFVDSIQSGLESPISYREIMMTMKATFAARDSLKRCTPVEVGD